MSIFDLYSKRRKREKGEVPDFYHYDDIPHALRVQVIHIWESALGNSHDDYQQRIPEFFKSINATLCREYGVFRLTNRDEYWRESVANFLLETQDADKVIDVIELTFQSIDKNVRRHPHLFRGAKQTPDAACDELNARFREHGIGYQYESGQIIRIDSQILHKEVVQPALRFLTGTYLAGANEEYLSAHEHYRKGNYKECLNDCLKAFESTIKSLCLKRKWAYNPTDTAKSLLNVVFDKGLIPSFMQSHFTGLRTTLEAGVPTVRNRVSGHGQGAVPTEVPESIAAYALHLTATNILLLVKLEKELS